MSTISRIHAVAADLSAVGISKDRTNEHQRFKFRGIDDVYAALSPLLAKHGLVIRPVVKQRIMTPLETAKGGTTYNVALEVEYWFSGTADLAGSVSATVWAEASDTGDKATSKALSMAYKTMAWQVFCIPTEGQEDPDAETPEPSRPKPMEFPPSFGAVEQAIAFLPNCRNPEDLKRWREAVKAEFAGDTDTALLKEAFLKFQRERSTP